MRITTTYKTNHNGTGQILARGAGKQRTVQYNDAMSPEWNHGHAAGTLIGVLVQGESARRVASKTAKVVKHRHNGKMTFSIGE